MLARIACLAICLTVTSFAHASVLNIGPGLDFTSISAGISAAQPNDELLIYDGIYNESFTVNKPLTLRAVNIGGAIIDGLGQSPVLADFDANADIYGLHFRNAAADAVHQRNVGVTINAYNTIVSNSSVGFSINNGAGRSGTINVYNSTIVDTVTAAGINDGGIIRIENSILDGLSNAYVNQNGSGILPSHNLLHNVTNRAVFGPSPGPIGGDGFEIVADPMFVNRQGMDFRLLPDSIAIDSGMNVGQPFLGSAPDRGALEFMESGELQHVYLDWDRQISRNFSVQNLPEFGSSTFKQYVSRNSGTTQRVSASDTPLSFRQSVLDHVRDIFETAAIPINIQLADPTQVDPNGLQVRYSDVNLAYDGDG